MKVVAVVPTLGKNVAKLNQLISSIRGITSESDLELVVVFNSSQQPSEKIVGADQVLFPGLNLGYVGALEWVRQRNYSSYLWVVQDDMALLNDALAVLLEQIEKDEKLAVVSPLLIREGIVPARTRGGVFTNKEKNEWENVPFSDTRIDDWTPIKNLSFVAGSGALFRTAALDEVGGFDVSLYPLMHVDVDICNRFLQNGYRMDLCQEAKISHKIGGSTPKLLSAVLNEWNRKIVISKMSRRVKPEENEHFEVSQKIVFSVAAKASDLVMHLSQIGEALRIERDALQIQKDELQIQKDELQIQRDALQIQKDAILSSHSWRLTKPLRALRRMVFGL